VRLTRWAAGFGLARLGLCDLLRKAAVRPAGSSVALEAVMWKATGGSGTLERTGLSGSSAASTGVAGAVARPSLAASAVMAAVCESRCGTEVERPSPVAVNLLGLLDKEKPAGSARPAVAVMAWTASYTTLAAPRAAPTAEPIGAVTAAAVWQAADETS
jgi:hypothetical protein